MKVLQCFHEYLRTTENWAYRLISGLPEVQNFIVTKRFYKHNFYHNDFSYFEYPLFDFPNPTNSRWLNIANKINHQFRKRYTYERFIARMAAHYDIQLMHSHFANVGWQYHPISKKLGIPHVISFYGFDYEKLPTVNPVWKDRYKMLFHEASAFICEGSHGAGLLDKMGCPEEKIHVVRLGIAPENIDFYSRRKESGSLKLVQIAAFRKKKGQIYTVRAFDKALKSCPDMELTLVGGRSKDGSKDEVLKCITDLNLQNKIKLVEKIDYEQIHQFQRDYDVFIHPSLYSEEMDCEGGAPIVLLDAQATGMPVISTFHCDIPDEVAHGKTGLLAQEKDVDGIAEHIKTFYHMKNDDYKKFSIQARNHVEKNFNADINAAALSAIYQKLTA